MASVDIGLYPRNTNGINDSTVTVTVYIIEIFCSMNSTNERQNLLLSIWSSFSVSDRSFLIEHAKMNPSSPASNRRTNEPKPKAFTLTSKKLTEAKPESKQDETDQSTEPSTKPSTTLATGYQKSRLEDLVRQHRSNTQLATQSITDQINQRTTFHRSKTTEPSTKIGKSVSSPVLKKKKSRSKNRLSLLLRAHSNGSSSNGSTIDNDTWNKSTSCTSSTSDTFKRQIIDHIETEEKTDDTGTTSIETKMSTTAQDEIVYHLLTQQMILEQTRNNGGCNNTLLTLIYPFFMPKAVSYRAKMTDIFIMSLVFINVAVVIITTEETLFHKSTTLLHVLEWFEYISFFIFMLEYVLRIYVCILDEAFAKYGSIVGRFKYVLTYNAVIDLIALIPSFIELSNGKVSNVGTGLRLWRVVRIMKLEHYSRAFATLKGGFKKQGQLWRLVLIYPIVALVIFSTLLR